MERSQAVTEAIAPPTRRAVCRYVVATDDTVVTLGEVATYVVTDEQVERDSSVTDSAAYRHVLLELHHVHLPKLADAGVLQYESDRKLARVGSNLPMATDIIQEIETSQ